MLVNNFTILLILLCSILSGACLYLNSEIDNYKIRLEALRKIAVDAVDSFQDCVEKNK